MLTTATPPTGREIEYPESDGKPMSDNTKQFQWIYRLYGNLEVLFADRPDVFVSGNQNWYPREGEPELCQAPDVYVVFGRPKGHRGSYQQWKEGDVPMTVVFEVLSPGNTYQEMADKLAFYDDYGVEEYYLYDPERNRLEAFVRRGTALPRVLGQLDGYVSPRLGIRFDLSGDEMVVRYPDGRPFLMMEELDRQRRDAERRADDAQKRAVRLAELTQKALLQQATTEEQEELRSLMASLLPPSPAGG
jgi:Uma2 family endonuclease